MSASIPITNAQQQIVIAETAKYIKQASDQLAFDFALVPVIFDLKGRAAGMYKVKRSERVIRYNPYLFSRYFDDNLANTVPHEVAHYLVDVLYGIRNKKPHGKEWKAIIAMFQADASVTCDYDMDDVPVKNYKRIAYRCSCQTHQLTRIRHNRALKGTRYHCRQCRQPLLQATGT